MGRGLRQRKGLKRRGWVPAIGAGFDDEMVGREDESAGAQCCRGRRLRLPRGTAAGSLAQFFEKYAGEDGDGSDEVAAVNVAAWARLDVAHNAFAHQDAELPIPAGQARGQLSASIPGGVSGNQ